MKFRTAYDPVEEHDHCGIEFTMPSLTVQDEKDETDINYIVNKYADGQKGIATLTSAIVRNTLICSSEMQRFPVTTVQLLSLCLEFVKNSTVYPLTFELNSVTIL